MSIGIYKDYFLLNRSHTNPIIIAAKDATKTDILEIFCSSILLNASVAIKILIVKPIPANIDAPII